MDVIFLFFFRGINDSNVAIKLKVSSPPYKTSLIVNGSVIKIRLILPSTFFFLIVNKYLTILHRITWRWHIFTVNRFEWKKLIITYVIRETRWLVVEMFKQTVTTSMDSVPNFFLVTRWSTSVENRKIVMNFTTSSKFLVLPPGHRRTVILIPWFDVSRRTVRRPWFLT